MIEIILAIVLGVLFGAVALWLAMRGRGKALHALLAEQRQQIAALAERPTHEDATSTRTT